MKSTQKCRKTTKFEAMFDDENDTLERIGAIEYDDFFKDYLLKNRLCVISSELTKKWRSRLEWVSDGRPNYDFLEECFGKE